MAALPSQEMADRLESAENIWFCSVRADGRPHMAPVWFIWHAGKIYIGTDPKSVKATNIRRRPAVTLALEDTVHPVICEGSARPIGRPWPEDILAAFFRKYEWDWNKEDQYDDMIEITPEKWLNW